MLNEFLVCCNSYSFGGGKEAAGEQVSLSCRGVVEAIALCRWCLVSCGVVH